MNVKEAVRAAMTFARDFFPSLENVELEEVDTAANGNFLITLGFDVPAPKAKGIAGAMTEALAAMNPPTVRKYKIFEFDQAFRLGVTVIDEVYADSRTVVADPDMPRFGLTDTAILMNARGCYLLLTDDFELSGYFKSKQGDVVNFNHIRMKGWQ